MPARIVYRVDCEISSGPTGERDWSCVRRLVSVAGNNGSRSVAISVSEPAKLGVSDDGCAFIKSASE